MGALKSSCEPIWGSGLGKSMSCGVGGKSKKDPRKRQCLSWFYNDEMN